MRKLLVAAIATGILIAAGGQAALAKVPGEEDPMNGAVPTVTGIPKSARPGAPWTATITFQKDGRTVAIPGFRPIVVLSDLDTTQKINVTAFATNVPGSYRATVTFPQAGRWVLTVQSLTSGIARHYPAINVKAPGPLPAPPGRGFPIGLVAGVLLAALAVAAALLLAPRRKRVAA